MLETILGSQSKEQVLLYLVARERGYASQIAEHFNTSITPIKRQLENLEYAGVLSSDTIGRTRLFMMNPRYPFRKEVRALIEKEISFMNETDKATLYEVRKRPRRVGKPL